MKNRYAVWIYDAESGFDSPMVCSAKSVSEARKLGLEYIKRWKLVGAEIIKVEILNGGKLND